MPPKLSIIIPTYNEATGIAQTIEELLNHARLVNAEIIVVNDGSTDQTPEIVNKYERIKLISHRKNQGYGTALVTGIRNSSGKHIIWYDGDGQHNPDDLIRVYDALTENELDYCIGVRDRQSNQVATRQAGKLILGKFVDFAAGEKVNDFNSGLRGFRRKVIMQYLHLFPKGFSASTTTTLILKERGYLGGEVPITAKKRVGKSSVNQLSDGLKSILGIVRLMLLFKPLWVFGIIGLGFVLTGTIYGFIETFTVGQGFPIFGALVIILGVQSFFFGLLNDQISQLRRERFEDQE